MKKYFTIVENNLSPSYKKACWEIFKLLEHDSKTNNDKFTKVATDITNQFPELFHTNASTSKNYIVADDIGDHYASFIIDAEKTKIIESIQYAISYAQRNNLLLLTADYLYRPDGTMIYFSKVRESQFPPTDKW